MSKNVCFGDFGAYRAINLKNPLGYEPNELPGCSTPHRFSGIHYTKNRLFVKGLIKTSSPYSALSLLSREYSGSKTFPFHIFIPKELMARIRSIKPDFWDDEKLSKIPMQARLTYIGLWNLSDDYGIVRSSANWVKSKLFPYDDALRTLEVQKWLDALSDARMLVPLVFENESYYKIRTWKAHQLIDRPGKRTIPEDDEIRLISEVSKQFGEDSTNVRRTFGSGREGKGKEGSGVGRFKQPTLLEVQEYCRERSNAILPEKFISYYEANGWKVGRYSMKDWKAAVRTWETNEYDKAPKKSESMTLQPDFIPARQA